MHEHGDCKHNLKYCSICDICYCTKCGREWGWQHLYHSYYPYYPYTITWYGSNDPSLTNEGSYTISTTASHKHE